MRKLALVVATVALTVGVSFAALRYQHKVIVDDCAINVDSVSGGKLSGATISGHPYAICLRGAVSDFEISGNTFSSISKD